MVSFAALQVINLIQTTFLLGFCLSLSFVSIPSILLSPSPILAIRQWSHQFETSKMPATFVCASSLLLSLVLAYGSAGDSAYAPAFRLYVASSVLSFLIFPFTLYYLQPLNNVLLEKRNVQLQLHYADLPEKTAGMQTARDHDKIAKWAWLHWFRVATFAGMAGTNAVALVSYL